MLCTHCGDECHSDPIHTNNLVFCCHGCMTVYNILNENGLDDYYNIESRPGSSFKNRKKKVFDYLEQPEVANLLLSSRIPGHHRITWRLPAIHCASCIWLLENLQMLQSGIHQVRVNFLKKEASILFDEDKISLRELAELLDSIGYDPSIRWIDTDKNYEAIPKDRSLLYKMGLAGFGFGNIMLLSFPEYLGQVDYSIGSFIGYLMILLATPLLFYSGGHYLTSAFYSLKYKHPGIDVPIALGMLTLYFRSIYEITSNTGDGYLDSLAGFIFFLLIGKWFQNYTHHSISFDRNYKSYFPVSSNVWKNNTWLPTPISEININEEIMIRNEEIIPCDGVLLSGHARIDYSFVTGESNPVNIAPGHPIFAGGKQKGAAIRVKVTKRIDQSYLTGLWNNSVFDKAEESTTSTIIDAVARKFTLAILVIAALTLGFWYPIDQRLAFNAFTAVLIIACPCVLALAVPFIYGNGLRILNQYGIFMKNVKTMENLQEVDTVIFDKTGTITDNARRQVHYEGRPLTVWEESLVKSLTYHSSHPLSISIYKSVGGSIIDVDFFNELSGQGIQGRIGEHKIRMGSATFIFGIEGKTNSQEVIIEIDGDVPGSFVFTSHFREGIEKIVENLAGKYKLGLLSGDNHAEKERMQQLLGEHTECLFEQKPIDKLEYINKLQSVGQKVVMIGDGLNDAGALKQSDVGMVISDDANNFTPSSDVILAAAAFPQLNSLFVFSRRIRYALYGGFVFSFLYNIVGLAFAVTGLLSPLVAAILMPVSSITIIVYGILISTWIANNTFVKKQK